MRSTPVGGAPWARPALDRVLDAGHRAARVLRRLTREEHVAARGQRRGCHLLRRAFGDRLHLRSSLKSTPSNLRRSRSSVVGIAGDSVAGFFASRAG
jgi:hypothetical protein